MDGFEQFDWESIPDLVKRFGGLLVAALIAWIARSRRAKQDSDSEEPEIQEASLLERAPYRPIRPGTDATKLSEDFSK